MFSLQLKRHNTVFLEQPQDGTIPHRLTFPPLIFDLETHLESFFFRPPIVWQALLHYTVIDSVFLVPPVQ